MQIPWIERLKQVERASDAPRAAWARWLGPISAAACVLLWEVATRIGQIAPIYLPAPEAVALKAGRALVDGTLARHAATTLIEALGGLLMGLMVAVGLGYALARWVAVERAVSPFIVASQAVPIVAIAPLLVIWFGYGLWSKILICALVVFFPILINTIAGLRSVPTDLRDLMRSLQATRGQIFWRLELPAALPALLAGLKVGATLSVIGAVVGEFAGSNAGLGYMVSIANGQYDTARMFVGVFALIVLALAMHGGVTWAEGRLLAGRRRQ